MPQQASLRTLCGGYDTNLPPAPPNGHLEKRIDFGRFAPNGHRDFGGTNWAITQWSNFGFSKTHGLRVGYKWAIFGLQSKTPTRSWRLLSAETASILVAREGFEPPTWVMSPKKSMRMYIDF